MNERMFLIFTGWLAFSTKGSRPSMPSSNSWLPSDCDKRTRIRRIIIITQKMTIHPTLHSFVKGLGNVTNKKRKLCERRRRGGGNSFPFRCFVNKNYSTRSFVANQKKKSTEQRRGVCGWIEGGKGRLSIQ